MPLPGLNFTALLAAILIVLPVCGLRPSRSGRADDLEHAEAGDRYLVALAQGVLDAVQHGSDRLARFALGLARGGGNGGVELVQGHQCTPLTWRMHEQALSWRDSLANGFLAE